ncbi:RDD family protein [Massilia antarctica]|uniref:RDD family protein n=1 Tax=Massilia antarctica TaxID=2765360 RepID=A0AA48WDJ1_9BURK|nr:MULTISPECIES: RDD family protein [Massilia]MCY0913820.1 RDD family protein [Massilia sp. H27-R4]QPI49783.1 RDD family protein [Massilia antarctica]
MQNSTTPIATPTLKRRLICMVYELFLLAAVVMFGLLVFLLVTQKMSQSIIEHGRTVVLFLVPGAYFIYSWTDKGYTLAMKTWRIKLVKVGYASVPLKAAVVRYLLAWGWVLPALVICWRFHLTSKTEVAIALAINVALWAMTAFIYEDRQFLHDRLAGTRLILLPKPVKAGKAEQAAKPAEA